MIVLVSESTDNLEGTLAITGTLSSHLSIIHASSWECARGNRSVLLLFERDQVLSSPFMRFHLCGGVHKHLLFDLVM